MRRRLVVLIPCSLVVLLGGIIGSFAWRAHSAQAAGTGNATLLSLSFIGDSDLSSGQGTTQVSTAGDQLPAEVDLGPQIPNQNAHNHPLPSQPPSAKGLAVTTALGAGTRSFDGLTHADARLSGTGIYTNTNFSGEPPDQGLCAGNGYVVEAINKALAVYRPDGTRISGPTALSQFYHLRPEIDRVNGVFGDFNSDPRCSFDSETRHWFITELQFDRDPATGVFPAGGRSRNLIAVSQTSDPTGSYALFSFDVTDDGQNGTPSHAGCPCFGDQPLIGFDHNGMYITTNEFDNHYPNSPTIFNGAQTYAISKAQLVNAALHGTGMPPVVAMDNANALAPYGGESYSLLPANRPTGSEGDDSDNQEQLHGVEYFMSALDFTGTDNRMAVWALTNTASLGGAHPNLTMQLQVIDSEDYASPGNVPQKAATSPAQTPYKNANAPAAPLEQIQSNDDRTNGNTVFAQGHLWTSLNTAIQNGSTITVGAAWFEVNPSFANGHLRAKVLHQGYVSVDNNNVLFGTVGLNAQGQGVISFSLVGPDYYPSAGYVRLSEGRGVSGPVHITGAGVGPADGFGGYPDATSQGATRWGDYGAVTIDADGNAWAAAEYIPNLPRTVAENFGTRITFIPAQGDD